MDEELQEMITRFPPLYFAGFTGYVLSILRQEGYSLRIVDFVRFNTGELIWPLRLVSKSLAYLMQHDRPLAIELLFYRDTDPYLIEKEQSKELKMDVDEYRQLLNQQPYLRRLYHHHPEFEEEFRKEEQILTQLQLNPNLEDVVRGLLYPVIVHRDTGVVGTGVSGDSGSESDSGAESVDSRARVFDG